MQRSLTAQAQCDALQYDPSSPLVAAVVTLHATCGVGESQRAVRGVSLPHTH